MTIEPRELQSFRETKLPYYQTVVRSLHDGADPYCFEGRVNIGVTERLRVLYNRLREGREEMERIEKRYRELEEQGRELVKQINDLQKKLNKKCTTLTI